MDIQDLGAIGEIVGGIAVIATLIYLALQIRQANVATHRNMYAQAATAISEYWLSLAKTPELNDSLNHMLLGSETQSESDRARGYLVMDSYLSLMESYFLHNRQYGERLSQDRWGRILQRMLVTPGGLVYWKKRKPSFHEEFADYIDEIVARGTE